MSSYELRFATVIALTIKSAAAADVLSTEKSFQQVAVVRLASIALLGACAIIMRLLGGARARKAMETVEASYTFHTEQCLDRLVV